MVSKFLPSLTLWWRDRWGSLWTTKIISTSPASSPTMSTSWPRTGSWTESCWTRTTESRSRGPSVYRSTTTDSSCVTAPASNCANYSLVQRDVTRILTSCSIAAWGTNWWFGSKDQLQHSKSSTETQWRNSNGISCAQVLLHSDMHILYMYNIQMYACVSSIMCRSKG